MSNRGRFRSRGILIISSFFTTAVILSCFGSCESAERAEFSGVVSSATPEASHVGELIFKKGGNAVDVAVAVSFALAVTEPAMSGLGGGTQVLLAIKDQPPIAINGTTLSPSDIPAQLKDSLTYHRRSTIPSTVKVLNYLFRQYGSGKVSWAELIEPSIRLAEEGFAVGPFRALVYKRYEESLTESPYSTDYFLIDGRIPTDGDTIKQPILANTLRRLSSHGAKDFYSGEIAAQIASDMAVHNGWIDLNDLRNFPDPIELKPLDIQFGDYTVYSQPPPCGGWTALLMLNILSELEESSKVDITSDDLIRALFLAHRDRDLHPVTELVHFEEQTKIKLSRDYAAKLLLESSATAFDNPNTGSGETTHFSVVDSNGNMIGVTASINAYFGAKAASPELGFLYNTYMDDFIFDDQDHPFAIRPNAMAYSSMSPTILRHQGSNVMVLGSPGSARIISSVAQVSANWTKTQDIESLNKVPRIHVSGTSVFMENPADSIQVDASLLKELGLKIDTASTSLNMDRHRNPYFGGIHAIALENGLWVGSADPRRDGLSIEVGDQEADPINGN